MLHGVRILPLFAVAIRIAHKIKDIEKALIKTTEALETHDALFLSNL